MPTTFAGFRRDAVGSVPVLWRRDDRFKTLRVSWIARRPLDLRAAARGLLPELLAQGTERDPSRLHLARRREALYGSTAAAMVGKHGETQVLHAMFDGVAGRFLPGGVDQLREGLAMVADLLVRPRLDGDGFPAAVFERERRNQANAVRAEFDDKTAYARRQVLALACAGEPMAIPEHGGLAAIEALDRAAPELARRDFLARGEPVVLAMGALEDDFLDAVGEFLRALPAAAVEPLLPPVQVAPRPAQFTLQRAELTQSKLYMVFRFPPGDGAAWLARKLFANMLGGGAHARLFREVREKRSLAYYAQAGAEHYKGLLMVSVGLDEGAAAAVQEQVLQQIEELRAGRFTDEELATAKAGITSGLTAVDDSIGARVGYTFERWLDGHDRDPQEQARCYAELDASAVANAAQGLWLDHTFLLAPLLPQRGAEGRA